MRGVLYGLEGFVRGREFLSCVPFKSILYNPQSPFPCMKIVYDGHYDRKHCTTGINDVIVRSNLKMFGIVK